MRSQEVSASGGGFGLEVQYRAVSRPALATPFEIRVTRRAGFDGPITIGIDRDGVPLVIVHNGVPIEKTLAAERLPIGEVFEAARQHGIESLDTVKLAVLEPTGRISFIQHTDR